MPGKVYVFRRRNDTWKQEAELQQQQESFGVAIAISARTIAVASSDLVFLYTDAGGGLKLQGTVEPRVAGEASGFQYGGPVAIDGNIMAVGALRYRKRKGAVHVFERVGSSWNQVATITGNDTRSDSLFGNRAGDLFGCSVSIYGATILVGASFHDFEGPNFGAGYVFRREGTQWVQTCKLIPPREPHSTSSRSAAMSLNSSLQRPRRSGPLNSTSGRAQRRCPRPSPVRHPGYARLQKSRASSPRAFPDAVPVPGRLPV